MSERVPYTAEEAEEARLWAGRHGPSNAWTASNGTAARMIGRLLEERRRLLEQPTLTDAEREAIWTVAEAYAENDGDPDCERIARIMQGLWQRTK